MRLPPLNAVKAFDAAARHLSFKRAAEELRVTQGAVSRHILNLEEYLGARLFERQHRQVRLTRDGGRYLGAVHDALVRIADASELVAAGRNERMLKLKLPPAFATRWLVPRLARFNALHPEMSIQVMTSHDQVNFDQDDADAAIRYGGAPPADIVAERLFGEVLVPVLCPALAQRVPLRVPADLRRHVLLHSMHRPADWPQFLARAGIAASAFPDGLSFENSNMTYQGALDGLGVAIAQVAFAQEEIRSGRLVVPFDIQVRNDAGYMFVVPRARARLRRIQRFRAWITEEARLTRESAAGYRI